jgi:hypothetical protein
VGQTAYTYLQVKKNGRTKLYRVNINRGRKSIELQTLAEEYTTSSVGSTCDDPTLPGCENNPEDPGGGSTGTGILTGELEIDGTTTDTIETGQPWDPSYSTAGWDETGFHCASRVRNVHFHWNGHYFETEGESQFIARIPSRTAGVVKGRYLLPNGPWLSTDGRARIWSGTVDANCYFVYTTVYGILLIETGAIAVYISSTATMRNSAKGRASHRTREANMGDRCTTALSNSRCGTRRRTLSRRRGWIPVRAQMAGSS